MKKAFALLFTLLFVMSCGGGGGGGGGGSAPATTGSININNGSSVPIHGIYITPVSSSSWGPNQISSPIATGSSRTIDSIPTGRYDGSAVHIGTLSSYYAYNYNFSVIADSVYNATITDSVFSGSISITNASSWATIIAAYVSPSSASTWGNNAISSSIGPNSARTIVDIPPGMYDLKIVWAHTNTPSYWWNGSVISLTTLNATANAN